MVSDQGYLGCLRLDCNLEIKGDGLLGNARVLPPKKGACGRIGQANGHLRHAAGEVWKFQCDRFPRLMKLETALLRLRISRWNIIRHVRRVLMHTQAGCILMQCFPALTLSTTPFESRSSGPSFVLDC